MLEGIVSELIDSFRAACYRMIYAGAVFKLLMTVCCNVFLQGVVVWEGTGHCFTLLNPHHKRRKTQ